MQLSNMYDMNASAYIETQQCVVMSVLSTEIQNITLSHYLYLHIKK